MHIDYLRYLVGAASAGSINKASRRFHMNQQHLSKIILSLEEDLGTPIFYRNNKGITPTAQGEAILQWAETVVSSYDALKHAIDLENHQAHQDIAGQLLISSISTIYGQKYNQLIKQFTEEYPKMSIAMEENSTREIIRKVKNDETDIGIILIIQGIEKRSDLVDASLQFIPCYKSKAVLYVSPKHRLAQTRRKIAMNELLDEEFIIYKPYADSETIASKTLHYFGDYHVKYTISNLSTFHDILDEGHYVHLGSSKASHKPLKEMSMIAINEKISHEVGLLVKKSRLNDPPVQAFTKLYQQIFTD